MKKWLDEWVFSPKSWEEMMTKVGAKRLLDLKADSTTGYSTRILRGKARPQDDGASVRRAAATKEGRKQYYG